MPEPEKMPTHRLDPRSLRGLAHPLRMRLLSDLRQNGPATASQLADRLGESSGATSYHLRQLAAYGFVEDDPERGKGRERWWRSVARGVSVDEALYDDENPEVRGAMSTFLHEVATMHAHEVSTWLGTMRDWQADWAKSADLSDFRLRLNPRQLGELTRKLHAVVDSYLHEEPGEGAEDVRLQLHAFPQKSDRKDR